MSSSAGWNATSGELHVNLTVWRCLALGIVHHRSSVLRLRVHFLAILNCLA